MSLSNNSPTIDAIIQLSSEDYISRLNQLYEAMLEAKLNSINEAVRTQVVTQNKNFSGIAGPIYSEGSSETTVNLQTGAPVTSESSSPGDSDDNYS